MTLASLNERSIHRVETTKELKLVDLGALAPRLGFKTRHVVQARGKEGEGYALPQALSKACMDLGYDGVVYNSAVYCPAGSLDGTNVVLFEGRGTQVKRISLKPVNTLLLWDRETVAEFLESLDAM
ncbi:RES domain-containing protein [Pseudomonas helleri]|uniref:RES domain-containing protein n=1 Tax=Pseudomonas helleri TaxID=1608996 RepID=UPI00381AA19F